MGHHSIQQFSVRLPSNILEELKKVSKEKEKSCSEYIKDLIEMGLEQERSDIDMEYMLKKNLFHSLKSDQLLSLLLYRTVGCEEDAKEIINKVSQNVTKEVDTIIKENDKEHLAEISLQEERKKFDAYERRKHRMMFNWIKGKK